MIAVTVALATAGFAFGEPAKGKGERGGDRPAPPEMLEKYDTNKDGKITKEEFLENGAEAIFAKLLEGLATLENVGEMMMMMMMMMMITSITNTM